MLNEQTIETILRNLYVDLGRAATYEQRNAIFADYAKRIAGMNDSEIVSLTEAAELLGISRQRAHVLVQNGQLDGFKVGNSWNIYRASVERRMNQGA